MKHFLLTLVASIMAIAFSNAQVNYNANSLVNPYTGDFRPGSNMGYNPPWQDEDLANLAAGNPALGFDGIGAKSIRPSLPGYFLEEYGLDFRVPTFQHYDNVGLEDNVCIIGFPADIDRDSTEHCPGLQSEMFEGLYLPIWDNGANGTPYNDDNKFAAYIHNVVSSYTPYVKFWEIWNEPGFDHSFVEGWQPPGGPNNWWDNDPSPCSNHFRAPIQQYVRTLRIAYDVIKTISPDDYVIVAGVGYESFLDAILRNTDNPNGGAVTAEYPHGGGAYFDVMGFHSYPHFDGTMREYDVNINGFVYDRHSDRGAEGILRRQTNYQSVLENYGYDGITHPKKEWIITEINLPRKQYQDYIGSVEAQINFIMKAVVTCMQNEIHQMHVYNLGDLKEEAAAQGEFDILGLYKKLTGTPVGNQVKNEEGIAYKTASDMLYTTEYDAAKTAAMNLPANIRGGAFLDDDGNYVYCIWAKTSQDQSEVASATYSFPASFGITNLEKREWDYSSAFTSSSLGPNNIQLTGRPIFLKETLFTSSISSGCEPLAVDFTSVISGADSYTWEMPGGSPATGTGPTPSTTYGAAGTYAITMNAFDAAGNNIAQQTSYVSVKAAPTADFDVNIAGPIINLTNNSSSNAVNYFWDLGDGTTSTEQSPNHVYNGNGTYTIYLFVTNECGSSNTSMTIDILSGTSTEIGYTANDQVIPYTGYFRPGSNLGYNPPYFDEDLADIAAGNPANGIQGAGVKSIRPSLPAHFLDTWGDSIKISTFQHYANLGLEENVCIVGFPSPDERDPADYCSGVQSEMFANMYSDIWDGGANGTPINDDNYLAAYLYKLINIYGEHIRFYEIWNEPGFDFTGFNNWQPQGSPGNWWDSDPDPCDYELRAPIYHYVRTLRISYEVIKYMNPDAYVTVAGVGSESFLDAILRNTDNPVNGSATADFPLGGGAYFDVMGFHSYPHFDGTMRFWDTTINGFNYQRHSDRGAFGITRRKNAYQAVLASHGYDGVTYPEKEWIITEINTPRKEFGDNLGSELSQRNFLMKAVVTCLQNDIHQMHVYNLAETEYSNISFDAFQQMGLYQRLVGNEPGTQIINEEGIGYKTSSDFLYGTRHDAVRTNAMSLPDGIAGGAFLDAAGNYIYCIWAETTIDRSEEANAIYSFPAPLNIGQLNRYEWDYSQNGVTSSIAPNGIELTSTPIFLTENPNLPSQPIANFTASATSGCAPITIDYNNLSTDATTFAWTFEGGTPATSIDPNPSVTYTSAGAYTTTLTVTNALGSHTATITDFVELEELPVPDFTYTIDGNEVTFTNNSTGAIGYLWDFGDSTTTPGYNPVHTFEDGTYTVTLFANGTCGQSTLTETFTFGDPNNPLSSSFTSDAISGCAPLTVNFTDLSSGTVSGWSWSFPGGTPATSTLQNPTVSYATAGTYDVLLTIDDGTSSNTATQTSYIVIDDAPTAGFSSTLSGTDVVFTNNSTNAGSYHWDFGNGDESTMPNPTTSYTIDGTYTVTLTADNGCGTDVYTQTIIISGNVTAPTTADFTADVQNGCGPLVVQFTDQSSPNATQWSWSFPGGTPATSSLQNPIVTYNNTGSFDATLLVSNSAGSIETIQTAFIEIEPAPIADFNNAITGSTVQFTDASQDATTYLWDFGDDNTSSVANPAHMYAEDGNYEVTLTVTNPCGTDVYTETVVISTTAIPVAAFNANQTSACAPASIQFFNQSSDNVTSWNWSFPGGTPSSSTLENPIVTYPSSGQYSVTLEATNSAGSNIAVQMNYISIDTAPSANFTFSNLINIYNFIGDIDNATSYAWNFGDGTISTDPNPSHFYRNSGTYTVILTTTNACGSSTTSQTINVIVLEGIKKSNIASSATNICAPAFINFADELTDPEVTRAWTFEGGTPATSTNPHAVISYDTPGVYEVKLKVVYANGEEDLLTSYVNIEAPSIANFNTLVNTDEVIFNNNSTDGNYTWDFGDGTISNQLNPTHEYSEPGIYTITLTSENTCGTDTHTEVVEINATATNATDFNIFTEMVVYPNPSNGNFTLTLNGAPVPQIKVSIVNIIGQTITSDILDFNAGNITKAYNLERFDSGAYIIKVEAADTIEYQKFIID